MSTDSNARVLRPLGRRLRITAALAAGTAVLGLVIAGPGAASPAVAAPAGWEGRALPFGSAPDLGGPGAGAAKGVVGVAATATGRGYWLVAADGGVFAYGDAGFHGSIGGRRLYAPVADVAASPVGGGYWMVAADGGVFAYGAPSFGSMGGKPLNAPVVAIAGTPSGRGYWLTAADGGVFAFGDAPSLGSMGGKPLNSPVVAIAGTPSGRGYRLFAADGGVFTFGDAQFAGAPPTAGRAQVVDGVATRSGKGYWLAAADGAVFAYGDAAFFGSAAGYRLDAPVVGVAASSGGGGYWLATGRPAAPAWSAFSTAGGRDIGEFHVTCYALRGTTATGWPVSNSVVAVDPAVIPYGSRMHIENVGMRIASDTGSAINGRRLDIWRPSRAECLQFGHQSLRVHLQ